MTANKQGFSIEQAPHLLVVDDETIVCRSCERIFEEKGYKVTTTVSPSDGISMATSHDYDAILLDIKMPDIDGVEFYTQLRQIKPNAPVLFITGYYNKDTAAQLDQLGPITCVKKPFTPEEILVAVQGVREQYQHFDHVQLHDSGLVEDSQVKAADSLWEGVPPEAFFFKNAWVSPKRGYVEVGSLLSTGTVKNINTIAFPQPRQLLRQGLPLVSITLDNGETLTIPAPVTGEVVQINTELMEGLSDKKGDISQWIARIEPLQWEKEQALCVQKKLLLLSADDQKGLKQAETLRDLHLGVLHTDSIDVALEILSEGSCDLVLLDDRTLQSKGPDAVQAILKLQPEQKIIVIASDETEREFAYRESGIFFYALCSFRDQEIIEVLEVALFPNKAQAPGEAKTSHNSLTNLDYINHIQVINRGGERISLLAPGKLLLKDYGIGAQIRKMLLAAGFPVEINFGEGAALSDQVIDLDGKCDRLIIIETKDLQYIPGTMTLRYSSTWAETAQLLNSQVFCAVLQPTTQPEALLEFKEETIIELARQLVRLVSAESHEMELVDLLQPAMHQSQQSRKDGKPTKFFPEAVGRLQIVNRCGEAISVLLDQELIKDYGMLGDELRKMLLSRGYPLETELAMQYHPVSAVVKATQLNDRVLFLHARELGCIPGTLVNSVPRGWREIAAVKTDRLQTFIAQKGIGGLLDSNASMAIANQIYHLILRTERDAGLSCFAENVEGA